MSNEKFTPAPWVIEPNSISNPQTRRCVVPFMKPINEQSEQGQANASLIACAPELLDGIDDAIFTLNEVLRKRLSNNMQGFVEQKIKKLETLAKKARGES